MGGAETTSAGEKEPVVSPTPERPSIPRKRFYEYLGATVLSAGLVITSGYYAARELIDKGRQTLSQQISSATDVADDRINGLKAGMKVSITKFDEAKAACIQVEDLAPAAEALRKLLPPGEGQPPTAAGPSIANQASTTTTVAPSHP